MDTLRKQSDKSTTCYFDSHPEVVNGLDLWPWPKLRHEMLRWDATTSDVEGCVDLNNPRGAASQFSLGDDDVPVLVVLDKMHDLKWSPFRCRIDHRDLTPSFDCRGAHSKRPLFQMFI